nr:hypothetical protein CFP56_25733 [Quercus suber]
MSDVMSGKQLPMQVEDLGSVPAAQEAIDVWERDQIWGRRGLGGPWGALLVGRYTLVAGEVWVSRDDRTSSIPRRRQIARVLIQHDGTGEAEPSVSTSPHASAITPTASVLRPRWPGPNEAHDIAVPLGAPSRPCCVLHPSVRYLRSLTRPFFNARANSRLHFPEPPSSLHLPVVR